MARNSLDVKYYLEKRWIANTKEAKKIKGLLRLLYPRDRDFCIRVMSHGGSEEASITLDDLVAFISEEEVIIDD